VARSRTTLIVAVVLLFAIAGGARAIAQATAAVVQSFPTAIIWRIEVAAVPVAPPVSSGERLFLALKDGVSARRLSDGSEIWRTPIEVDAPMAVSHDRLVVVVKEEVQALDAATGSVVWSDHAGALTAPPAAYGEWLFVAAGEQIICYRVADGTRVWARDTGAVEQRPALEGARVFVPAADGRVLALALATGEPLWEQLVGIKPTEPLVYGGRVLVGTQAKRFCSLKPETGKDDWCFPHLGAAVVGRPAADATHVYFVGYDNVLRAHDRRNGAFRWRRDLKYRPAAGPYLVGNSIAVPGNVPHVQVFETRKGTPTVLLTLATKLATVPLLIEPDGGEPKVPTRIAAVTGGLEKSWTVTLAGPALEAPAIPITPLTELPGAVIPIAAPPLPPGRQPPGA
jgi:outer membrane protein assembly factor BamB